VIVAPVARREDAGDGKSALVTLALTPDAAAKLARMQEGYLSRQGEVMGFLGEATGKGA